MNKGFVVNDNGTLVEPRIGSTIQFTHVGIEGIVVTGKVLSYKLIEDEDAYDVDFAEIELISMEPLSQCSVLSYFDGSLFYNVTEPNFEWRYSDV